MATGSASLDQLTLLYKHVIDDVVRNMKEEYLNEGVDTELLEELKQIWLSKLNRSGAVSRPAKPEIPPRTKDTPSKNSHKQSSLVQSSTSATSSASSLPQPPPLISPPQATASSPHHAHSSVPKASSIPGLSVAPSAVNPGGVPSTSGHASRVTASAVSPASGMTPAMNPFPTGIPGLSMVTPGGMGQMLPIQTTNGTVLVNMQTFMALNKLQQQQQQSSSPAPSATPPAAMEKGKDVVQIDGLPPNVGVATAPTGKKSKFKQVDLKSLFGNPIPKSSSAPDSSSNGSGFHIAQLDGYGSGNKGGGAADDSSSDDDSDVDDSSVDDPGSAQGDMGSPLNSNDDIDSDVDDPEASDDFETRDVIVCQWEKVYRVKNKWKFLLKDGVMHLNGYDYVFHKVSGEADW